MHENQIIQHADKAAPHEACGLVVRQKSTGKLVAVECPNSADDPTRHFRIEPEHYLGHMRAGSLVGVYHSHPGSGADPSPADIEASRAMNLPFWIFGQGTREMRCTVPHGARRPLLGREFIPQYQDCVSLVSDAAALAGFAFPHIPRTTGKFYQGTPAKWLAMVQESRAAFTDRPRPGTVVVMALQSKRPNHLGLYIGNNTLLHQTNDQPSRLEVWGGSIWERMTTNLIDVPEMIRAGAGFENGTLDYTAND